MYSGALSGCVWCTHEYSQAVCGVLRSTLRLCVVYSGVLSGCVWCTQDYYQAVTVLGSALRPRLHENVFGRKRNSFVAFVPSVYCKKRWRIEDAFH